MWANEQGGRRRTTTVHPGDSMADSDSGAAPVSMRERLRRAVVVLDELVPKAEEAARERRLLTEDTLLEFWPVRIFGAAQELLQRAWTVGRIPVHVC